MQHKTTTAGNRHTLSPILRAAMAAHPVLTPSAEVDLTTRIVAAHASAWHAVLTGCVRPTRRAAILSRAYETCGGLHLGAELHDPEAVALTDIPRVVVRAFADDRDQTILRAAQAVALDDCDDALTSPRASLATRTHAAAWRRHILATAAHLARLEGRMVAHNLGLAVSVALTRVHSGVPLDDLVQAGSVGLLTAVRRFDPSRGLRFSTMATHWVRHNIRRHIEATARTIRLPVYLLARINDIRDADAELHDLATDMPASTEQVAAHLNLTAAQVERARHAGLATVSLDDDKDNAGCDKSPHGRRASLGERIGDPHHVDADYAIATAQQRHALTHAIDRLPIREAYMVHEVSGLGGAAPRRETDVAREVGIPRGQASHYYHAGLSRLRREMAAHV